MAVRYRTSASGGRITVTAKRIIDSFNKRSCGQVTSPTATYCDIATYCDLT